MRRRLPLAGGAAGLALLVAYLVVWGGVSPTRQRGSDFSVDYVAAQLLRDGRGSAIYDQGLEASAHARLLPPDTLFDLPYISPPTAALLTVPLTLTDPGTAYRIWGLAQLAMLAAAMGLAARASPWAPTMNRRRRLGVCLLVAATPATLVLLLMGQWDGLLALAVAAGYAALGSRRPVFAGMILGLAFAATKPHLALGLAAFLVGRREWRALAAAAVGVAAVVLASMAVAGTGAISGFAGAVGGALSNTPPRSTLGFAGLVSSWLGSGPVTASVVVVGSLAALVACGALGGASRSGRLLAPSFGGAVALSLLIAPHVLAHDLVLLAPVAVIAIARYSRRNSDLVAPLAAWLGLGCLIAVDAGNSAAGPPGRLVPLALAAAGAAALGMRRARPMAEVAAIG